VVVYFANEDGVREELTVSGYEGEGFVEVSEAVGRFFVEKKKAHEDREKTRSEYRMGFDPTDYEHLIADPQDRLESLLASMTVKHALSKLTPKQQRLVRKIIMEGWQTTEIAKHDGISDRAIRYCLRAAKERLKKIF